MRSTGTADLLRSHLALSTAGLLLHGLAALPAAFVALAPAGFTIGQAPGALLPALLAASLIELPLIVSWYRPVAALDTLSGDALYAQNPILAAGVIRLLSLPVRSVARIALLRGPVTAAVFFLLASRELPGGISAAAGREFWLLLLTLVPLAGAGLEFFLLPERITARYGTQLAYRTALQPLWQARIVSVPMAIRLTIVILALAIVPMAAVGVGPDRTLHTIVLGATVLLSGAVIIGLMHRDEQRSLRSLIEAMHRIVHHRTDPAVPSLPADAHTPLVDGFSRMAAELREQTFIHDTFGKHVPRSIVQGALRDGIRLQGEQRDIALLQVRLRDFPALIARRTPEGVVSLLNSYLGMVIAAAHHYGGTVDRVHADRVLIVFGAPVVLDAPVDRALHAAADIRAALARFSAAQARSGALPLRMAAGVHHGAVVAGHIGAAGRWEYTFVGEAIQAAEAIADAARAADTDLLVSAPAQAEAGPDFRFTAGATLVTLPDGSTLSCASS
jgi:class 3 adenylate cyclase